MGFDVISYVLAKKSAIAGSLDPYVKEQLETLESELKQKADIKTISETYAKKTDLDLKFGETDIATEDDIIDVCQKIFNSED